MCVTRKVGNGNRLDYDYTGYALGVSSGQGCEYYGDTSTIGTTAPRNSLSPVTIDSSHEPAKHSELAIHPLRGGYMWALSKHSRQMALERSQLQEVILQRTAELQNLSQRLLKVRDEERRKLSRDLHDSTGQILAALKINISFLQESCKQDPSKMALVSEALELTDQIIEEIRTMSYLLHPPLLDEVGFVCAAE
jgi:signal transduction histidine kinase